ncbi:MAG: signal recognition particle-docking protein FtsY [Lachnospiraceae bacterium]|nr:signal recognition particle-docking protein FtsY [Lachnospiraceae bacterium]
MGLFSRLKAGLTKTRNNIVASMDSIFSNDDKIDEDFYDELEEILILGDIGVHTTENILDKLRGQVKSEHIKKKSECREFLINTIKEEMAIGETAYEFEKTTSVVFVIGVNGVGKTTSIGKLASHLKAQGRKVMLAACDTFRAAAGSQLEEWSHRAGVEMIGGVEGQDPSSVLFDAVTAAKARGVDVLLVDTAGRLHNKKNLMEELKKMNRIIDKVFPEVHRENMIVLDASTGQNALNQAKEFGEVANLTGIILTKMDGTAKGGIAIAIQSELGVPVKYIGVGEKIVDLQKFNADSFVDALFDVKLEEEDNE